MREPSRRVLIFDANNEYGEYGIKTIALEHLPVFMAHPKKEIRRILPFNFAPGKAPVKMTTAEMLTTLEKIVQTFMGGCLVIEDPNKYIGDAMSNDLTGSICTNRHNSCDMIMHYQSISRPLPKIHQNTNVYRFHYQSDDVERSKSKLQELTTVFKIAQIMVDKTFFMSANPKHPCKYYHVFVNRDSGKIVGNYTKKQFDEACEEYISVNHGELKPWLVKRGNDGKPIFTYPQAVEAFRKQLGLKYYGNAEIGQYHQPSREAKLMIATGFKGTGKTRETMRFLLQDY